MKKIIILFLVLLYCVQGLWAQSLNDGMYSKEWEEERDRINKIPLYKPKNFYTPVNYDVVYRGIRIERDPEPTSKSKRASTVKTSKSNRTYSVGSYNNSVSHYGELRQQWLEKARREEYERKKRIAAENAADRQMGYARHTAMMSGFYSQKYARDQYIMHEGARRLDESVHAMDFASVPEQKVEVMKGNEMADLLKGGIELRYEKMEVLFKDKQFETGDKLNVTDNLEMDEDILESWDKANMEDNVIDLNLKDKKSKKNAKQPEVLVSREEICLDSFDLFILPQYGLVMQIGDSMRVLKDYELRAVSWADGKRHSYIVPCGDKLIGRDDRAIYDIKKANSAKILEFDTSDFSLFAGNDSTIYCVFWYENISSIFKVNVVNSTYNEIARLPAYIWKVESNGTEAFVMIDNTILVLNNDETPHMFYKSDDYINDVTLSPWGILIATDKEIIRIKSATECETFYAIAAKHIWCDGNEVYIQSKAGDLLYMKDGADYITN